MTRTIGEHARPARAGRTKRLRQVDVRRADFVPETRLPFVNADELEAQHWPGDELAHAYEASALAARVRNEYIDRRASFITETVFSHPSKIELVRSAVASG